MAQQNKGSGSLGLWGQIRWQLAACYLLIGGVSVLLVAAFAATALNLILMRASTAQVERQVDLMVAQVADRADSFATRMITQAESGDGPDRRMGGGRGPGGPRGLQNARASIRCQDAKGKVVTTPVPGDSVLEIPTWMDGESFQGVVSDGPDVWLQALVRRKGERCAVVTSFRIPVDDEMAALLARSLELEVSHREPLPPGGNPVVTSGKEPPRPPEMRGPPSFWKPIWLPVAMIWRPLGAPIPVALVTRDWKTGQFVDRIPFSVRPNYATTFRQLERFGRRQAVWVRALWTLGIAFVVVELIALWLAIRVTRRIVGAVDRLSHAAAEIGQGNLSYRIPVERDDQLGRLSLTFNHMAESVKERMQETREKEQFRQELLVARQVQESLNPPEVLSMPGVDLAAACQPARNVSGDLYDIVGLGDGRVGLLCADVSGKGIPAALLSASVQAMVRSAAQNGSGKGHDPAELVTRLNAQLCPRVQDNRFVTLFWAEYDSRTRTLRSTNAGHCPPVVLMPINGDVKRLHAGGPPVGIFPNATYQMQEVVLPLGSVLVLFTDGIPEATNAENEEFGEDRLIGICQTERSQSAKQLVKDLLNAREAWAHDIEQADDLTVVVLKA